ncbi:MAG: hypothetical protein AB7J19_11015, partial [Beijerinckiaceae bacterium]
YNPAAVMRMIDMGRDWIAMMCATEANEKVVGMDAPLRRLAESEDEEISVPAKWQLEHYYA